MEGEFWREVEWTHGLYSVSNYGRLRSNHPRSMKRVLRTHPQRWGHRQFAATLPGGEKRTLTVHREVLIAFGGPPTFEGALALHNDGDTENNHISNLRWGTAKDNYDDAVAHGTMGRGELNPNAKMTEAMVRQLRAAADWKAEAERLGVHREAARCAVKGKTWGWLK